MAYAEKLELKKKSIINSIIRYKKSLNIFLLKYILDNINKEIKNIALNFQVICMSLEIPGVSGSSCYQAPVDLVDHVRLT